MRFIPPFLQLAILIILDVALLGAIMVYDAGGETKWICGETYSKSECAMLKQFMSKALEDQEKQEERSRA